MFNFAKAIAVGGGASFLTRFGYVEYKQKTMVKKSYKKFSTRQKVFLPEEKKLVIDRKLDETQIAKACNISGQVLVYGPKKIGKSTLLMQMSEERLKNRAIYVKVEDLGTKKQVMETIAEKVGYDSLLREESALYLTMNPHLWNRTGKQSKVEHHKLGNYLQEVSIHYKALHKNVMPILIIDGLNSVAKEGHPEVIRELLYISKGLAERKLMSVILGTTDGEASRIIQENTNPFRKHIWVQQCTDDELKEFLDKVQSKIVEKTKEIAKKTGKEAKEEGERFRKMAEDLNDTLVGNYLGKMNYLVENYLEDPGTAKEDFIAKRLAYAEEMLDLSGFDWYSKGKKESEDSDFNLLLQKKVFPKLLKEGTMTKTEYLGIMTDHKAAAKEFITCDVFASHKGMIFFQGKEMEIYIAAKLKKDEEDNKKDTEDNKKDTEENKKDEEDNKKDTPK